MDTFVREFLDVLTCSGPVPQLNPSDRILKGSTIVTIVEASVPMSIVPLSSIVTETIIGISTPLLLFASSMA